MKNKIVREDVIVVVPEAGHVLTRAYMEGGGTLYRLEVMGKSETTGKLHHAKDLFIQSKERIAKIEKTDSLIQWLFEEIMKVVDIEIEEDEGVVVTTKKQRKEPIVEKKPYTGKKRGPKPKNKTAAA